MVCCSSSPWSSWPRTPPARVAPTCVPCPCRAQPAAPLSLRPGASLPPLLPRPRRPFLLATATRHGRQDPLGGEILLPVIIFDNQRLESTFLDSLKLMLSSFQRVPRVSALVPKPCRRRHAAARREPRARAPVLGCRAPPLRPALLNPSMAAPSSSLAGAPPRCCYCRRRLSDRPQPQPSPPTGRSRFPHASPSLPGRWHGFLSPNRAPEHLLCSNSRQGPRAEIQTSIGGFLQCHRLIGIVSQGPNRLKL